MVKFSRSINNVNKVIWKKTIDFANVKAKKTK